MRTQPTEAETQKAILEVLALHGVFAGRLNTGAGFVNGRPIQHHTFGKGCADILAFPRIELKVEYADGRTDARIVVPTWIEVKAPGKKAGPEQIGFQQHVRALGHDYLLVDSVDQILVWIKTL